MPTINASDGPPFPGTIERIHALFARFDMAAARADEVEDIRAFAADLIGSNAIVAAQTLWMVHAQSGAGLFLARENGTISGAYAFVLLNQKGLEAVRSDRFDAISVDMTNVAASTEEPAGVYGWGIAASNPHSARRVVHASCAMTLRVTPHLPFYGRAMSIAGRRLLVDRLKFRPVKNSRTGLLVYQPPKSIKEMAA